MITVSMAILLTAARELSNPPAPNSLFWYEAVGGSDYDRCSWYHLANIDMSEARCEPVSRGIIPQGSYIAGPTLGDFERSSNNITIALRKRHHPHLDGRKFLMLVDKDGQETFKACGPVCVDVDWNDVPTGKRITGFGRKGKQNALPENNRGCHWWDMQCIV